MLHLSPRQDALSVCQCPDGEIGKRCGLRSRWSKILESSSLSSGTVSALIRLTFSMLGGFLFYGVINSNLKHSQLLLSIAVYLVIWLYISDAGQLNTYLNYYKAEINDENDNPPIGIILCAEKHEITAGILGM